MYFDYKSLVEAYFSRAEYASAADELQKYHRKKVELLEQELAFSVNLILRNAARIERGPDGQDPVFIASWLRWVARKCIEHQAAMQSPFPLPLKGVRSSAEAQLRARHSPRLQSAMDLLREAHRGLLEDIIVRLDPEIVHRRVLETRLFELGLPVHAPEEGTLRSATSGPDPYFPPDDGSLLDDVPIDPDERIEFDKDGNLVYDGLAKYRLRAEAARARETLVNRQRTDVPRPPAIAACSHLDSSGSDSSSLRVRIHRGAAQVGGTCIELESGGKRILLDLGMPLDADEREVPLPDVPGLAGDDPSLLGIVISHLHGDHCGLVPYAAPWLPVAMGPVAARIVREAEFFTGRAPLPEPRWPLVDRQAFEIGPFRITPYQVEHSAFDAFALLVEADGRRLFYTGDFRAHGNNREPFSRLIRDPPRNIHALMMEGTQIGDGREGDGLSETELRGALVRRFREHPGIILAAWSSQNLDRTRTMYEAALAAGRTLVVDLYTATLAKAARAPGVPVPGVKGLEVFCRERERIQVKAAEEFGRTRSVYHYRIFPEHLPARASELVLMFRPSMVRELERAGALSGALAIWSMWRGYLTGPAERRMSETLSRHGVPLEVHHVSGHAYVQDLRRIVDAVQPKCVIPIHTDEPDRYLEVFPGAELRRDGEWWSA
jgi:ribonuclease J